VIAWVYTLRCSDGRYYVGLTRNEQLEARLNEHHLGASTKAYTYSRRPLTLVWAEEFASIIEAITCERRLKGWSRAKKEALIRGDFDEIVRLSNLKRAAETL